MATRLPTIPRRLRRRLLYPLLAGGRAALAALPHHASGRLAGLAAGVALRYLSRERTRMTEHLGLAFPEKPEAERAAIGEAAFRHFARVFVEAARLSRMSDAEVARLVRLDDPHGVLERVAREGRGGLAVTAHLGNWELLAAVVARRGLPVKVVATRFRDTRVNDLLVALRAASGIETLQRDEGPRPLLRALKGGFLLGLLIDQDTDVDGCFVPFFGRPAFTTRGPGVLHLATGAPVFTLFCTREPDGAYVLRVEPPLPPASPDLSGVEKAKAVEEIIAELTRRIEAAVRRYPEQWVWWHQRWKTRPGEQSLP